MKPLLESQRKLSLIINKLPLINQNIKIEGEFNESKSDISDRSDKYDEFVPRTSTVMKSNEFMIHLNTENSDTQDNSAYSLGDEDKLYQKLDKLIKIFVQNWFKKKTKKPMLKLTAQLTKKILKLSPMNEDSIGVQTPSKGSQNPYTSFRLSKMNFNEDSQSQSQTAN